MTQMVTADGVTSTDVDEGRRQTTSDRVRCRLAGLGPARATASLRWVGVTFVALVVELAKDTVIEFVQQVLPF